MKTTLEHIIKEEFYYDSLDTSSLKSCEKQVISYSTKCEGKEFYVFEVQTKSPKKISAINDSELIEFIMDRFNKKNPEKEILKNESTLSKKMIYVLFQDDLSENMKIQVIKRLLELEKQKQYKASQSLVEECDKIISSLIAE